MSAESYSVCSSTLSTIQILTKNEPARGWRVILRQDNVSSLVSDQRMLQGVLLGIACAIGRKMAEYFITEMTRAVISICSRHSLPMCFLLFFRYKPCRLTDFLVHDKSGPFETAAYISLRVVFPLDQMGSDTFVSRDRNI